MKKAKLISAISLIMLCICMLSVGIIASNAGNSNVGVGGTIYIPENKIGVSVKAYIIQGIPTADQYSDAVTPDYDSSLTIPVKDKNDENKIITCCGETWQFTAEQLQKMTFDLSKVNTEEDLKNVQVTIVFVIKNMGTLNLQTKFTTSPEVETPIPNNSDVLTTEEIINGETQNVNTVSVTFTNAEIGANESSACSMAFNPLRFVNEAKSLTFNYTLNVVEGKVAGGNEVPQE